MPLVCPRCQGKLLVRHNEKFYNDTFNLHNHFVLYCENYKKCDFEIRVKKED